MSDQQQDSGAGAAAEEPKTNFLVQYFKDFGILKETKKEYWGLQVVNMLDCLA